MKENESPGRSAVAAPERGALRGGRFGARKGGVKGGGGDKGGALRGAVSASEILRRV